MAKRAASRRKSKRSAGRRTAARKTTTRKTAKRKSTKQKSAKRSAVKRRAVKRVTAVVATARVALDVTAPANEEQLKTELDAAISAFNVRRAPLLKKAFDEGGDAAVTALEQQHDALRTAFFDLLRRQLDRNNAQFEELTKAATQETVALKEAIESLEKVTSIIKRATSVVGMIGKVITVLGA